MSEETLAEAQPEKTSHVGACDPLVRQLKSCLLKSDCVLKEGHLPSECIKDRALYDSLPDECRHLRKALWDCKRAKLDMRKRFRGNTAASKIDSTSTASPASSS